MTGSRALDAFLPGGSARGRLSARQFRNARKPFPWETALRSGELYSPLDVQADGEIEYRHSGLSTLDCLPYKFPLAGGPVSATLVLPTGFE